MTKILILRGSSYFNQNHFPNCFYIDLSRNHWELMWAINTIAYFAIMNLKIKPPKFT